jgi:hypothetical protein
VQAESAVEAPWEDQGYAAEPVRVGRMSAETAGYAI